MRIVISSYLIFAILSFHFCYFILYSRPGQLQAGHDCFSFFFFWPGPATSRIGLVFFNLYLLSRSRYEDRIVILTSSVVQVPLRGQVLLWGQDRIVISTSIFCPGPALAGQDCYFILYSLSRFRYEKDSIVFLTYFLCQGPATNRTELPTPSASWSPSSSADSKPT